MLRGWKVITSLQIRREPPFCYFTDRELLEIADKTLSKPENKKLLQERLDDDPEAQATGGKG